MIKRRMVCAVAATAACLLVPAGASAQSPTLDVRSPAHLNKDGSVRVKVLYTCGPGVTPLEGNISLSQDDGQISGMGGLGPLTCDGRRRTANAVVTSFGDPFHRGAAFASAFLLVQDPATGGTEQAQATETIQIR
jgi:hypothetical protein